MPQHSVFEHEESGDAITSSIVSDGSKNTVFLVTGTINSKKDSVFDIIDTQKLGGKPHNIRLDNIMFSVESGLKVLLKYKNEPYVLPLEGRSKIDLEPTGGLVGHEIDFVFKGTGSFFIVLDISKMGV